MNTIIPLKEEETGRSATRQDTASALIPVQEFDYKAWASSTQQIPTSPISFQCSFHSYIPEDFTKPSSDSSKRFAIESFPGAETIEE